MRIQKKTSVRRRLAAALATGTALVLAGVGLTALPAAAASVDTGAYYVLVNRQSAKALEVRDFSTADGGIMQQWTRNDGNWQQFKFIDSGSGWYRLQNRHSGKVLDVWGWSTADGGEIRQYTDANAANQKFKLVDSEGGRVRLVNQNSGKAVTVTDRSTADGATITQLTEKNQYNQQWELVKVGSGSEPTSNPTTPPATGLVGLGVAERWHQRWWVGGGDHGDQLVGAGQRGFGHGCGGGAGLGHDLVLGDAGDRVEQDDPGGQWRQDRGLRV